MTKPSIQDVRDWLAFNVRTQRSRTGLAQERLALEAGVDRTMVSKIERGLTNPSLETLLKLSNHMGISISDLLRKPN